MKVNVKCDTDINLTFFDLAYGEVFYCRGGFFIKIDDDVAFDIEDSRVIDFFSDDKVNRCDAEVNIKEIY